MNHYCGYCHAEIDFFFWDLHFETQNGRSRVFCGSCWRAVNSPKEKESAGETPGSADTPKVSALYFYSFILIMFSRRILLYATSRSSTLARHSLPFRCLPL